MVQINSIISRVSLKGIDDIEKRSKLEAEIVLQIVKVSEKVK